MTYAMGSETELTTRLARLGFQAWHCRSAVVEHIIRPSQLTEAWLRRRAERFGRRSCRLEYEELMRDNPRLFGVPRYLLRQILARSWHVLRERCKGDRTEMFAAQLELSLLIGKAREARRLQRT